jgi:hypothetical protein
MKNPRPLNVLLIVADQWRGDSLGSLGHRAARTPNLDALAREGVLFRQHYTPGAPCAPARHSLLTGQYVMNHGVMVNGAPLDDRHPTLPRELRRGEPDVRTRLVLERFDGEPTVFFLNRHKTRNVNLSFGLRQGRHIIAARDAPRIAHSRA